MHNIHIIVIHMYVIRSLCLYTHWVYGVFLTKFDIHENDEHMSSNYGAHTLPKFLEHYEHSNIHSLLRLSILSNQKHSISHYVVSDKQVQATTKE